MNELALFAGSGGSLLVGHLLGWRTICAVELNPYCASVLVARQNDGLLPPFPIWDDIRTFEGKPWKGRVGVVSGGFPCQRFSKAARGRNNAPDLWPEMRRIVSDVAPSCVFAENVTREAIEYAAGDLIEMGYYCRAMRLSASDLGADHDRERFWLLAHSDRDGQLRSPIDAKVEMLPEFCPRVWASFPNEPRVPDGVAHRMERLSATGNGWVPAVGAAAFRILSRGLRI